MSNIITASRESGSGGRKLGKRLIPMIATYAKAWFEEEKADE